MRNKNYGLLKSIKMWLIGLSKGADHGKNETAAPKEVEKHAWDRVYTKEELDNLDWDLIDEDAVIFGQAMVHKAYTDSMKKKKQEAKNKASDK